MWLLIVAAFGFVVPNGIFVYWLLTEFNGVGPVLQNKLAVAFMLDALLTMVILAYYFARFPPGPVQWYWFVVLSLIGGLVFSLPFYWWLNTRARGAEAARYSRPHERGSA